MFFLSYSTDAQKVSYKKLNELNLYILREKNISEEFIDMVSKKVFKHEGEFTIPSSHYKPFTIKQFKELKIYFNQIDKEKKYETIFEFAPLDIKN